MGRVARAVPTLLLHVNLLLTLFAGAILSTAVRLKWDPTAYIAARELFPLEYRMAAVALPVAGAALALLAHLALTALRCVRFSKRRVLFIVYAALMVLLVMIELALGWWLAWRVRRWLGGSEAAEVRHALELRDHLHPLLQHLAHYNPLPQKVHELMEEAESDAPRNLVVLGCASGLLLALQVFAAALALCAGAVETRWRRRPEDTLAYSTTTITTPLSSRRGDSEKAPLRAVYKDGRLVLV